MWRRFERNNDPDRCRDFNRDGWMVTVEQRPCFLEGRDPRFGPAAAQARGKVPRGRHSERIQVIDDSVERPDRNAAKP
jgi:hypothetical protein